MQFGKLLATNFMSVKSAEVDFNNRGLVLIQGSNNDADSFESNGAGKSTLFSEAPTWVLTGKTVRGQKDDKVVNRSVGKNTSVSLEIIEGSDVYKIIRHRKHSEHGNHVFLYKNGNNITGKSDTDTNEMIEDLIQMDYSTFTNSIMFGQGVSKLFASSSDKEQKQILEKMLQIDIYKECMELAKNYLSDTNKMINRKEEDEVTLRNSIEYEEGRVTTMQNHEAEMERQITNEINSLVADKTSYEVDLGKLSSLEELDKELDGYEDMLLKVKEKIESYKEVEEYRQKALMDVRYLKDKADDTDNKITKKTRELNDLKSKKNVPKNCRACGQELPLGDTTHMENHLEEAIRELESELSSRTAELESLENILSEADSKLKSKEPIVKQLNSVQDLIQDVNLDIKIRNSREKDIKRSIASLDKAIAEKRKSLDISYSDIIDSTIKTIKQYKENLNLCLTKLEELKVDKENYEFWVNGFGNKGIKSVLLDSVVPFLNMKANYYLGKLADSSIEVQFSTQSTLKNGEKRDKFSVDVINENGDNDYKGSSGGEKRRIDIAVNMALQDLVSSRSNKSIDLIVYDEMFDGLDAIGCETVMEILKEKAVQVGTIYVITHNDNLKQLFTNVVTVDKNNGETTLLS